jgi:uracil-DNA glycosylase family 4
LTVPRDPARECSLCPRLTDFRNEARRREPAWHNAPVPSFGRTTARLLIVGLAPGLSGANRTGRPFTGDHAGHLLYATLAAFGFTRGTFAADAADGLELVDTMITNAVRCVPPGNKPEASEIATCRTYLETTIAALPALGAIVALGRIAHDSTVRALGRKPSGATFAHAAIHNFGDRLRLFDSYHCSRYNTNTGVLTPTMFHQVFAAVSAHLAQID